MTRFPDPASLTVLDDISALEAEPEPSEAGPDEPSSPEPSPPESSSPESSSPEADTASLVHAELICEACRVELRLNGVPVATLDAPAREHFAPPLNPYLVSGANLLELEVHPPSEAEDPLATLHRSHIELGVRRFGRGDAVAPGAGAELASWAVHEELRSRIDAHVEASEGERLELPQIFAFDFEVDGPHFDAELRDAPPLTDEAALRAHAIHLRDLARSGDVDALALQMEAKVQAYARAYATPAASLRESLQEGLAEMLALGLELEFEAHEVELMPAAGGRLWRLERRAGRPLLQTAPDADGGTRQIEVWVGAARGALVVCR